jgi:bisphosphoglycerate-dependent phosphoglycerate mutase
VFIRHGQSDFNKYEIFTGWCDVDVNKIVSLHLSLSPS